MLDWYVLQWGAGSYEDRCNHHIAFTSPTLGTRRYDVTYEREGDDFVRVWPPRVLSAGARKPGEPMKTVE